MSIVEILEAIYNLERFFSQSFGSAHIASRLKDFRQSAYDHSDSSS